MGIVGGIIVVLIILIAVFLICREYMCWYFKINKLIELMEEQNNLIKQQMGISSTSNILLAEFIPTHRVKLLTTAGGLGLRKKPDPSIDSFTKIPNATEVQHINTGDDVKLKDIKAPWFEIRTKEGICGWCFSGSLEKIS